MDCIVWVLKTAYIPLRYVAPFTTQSTCAISGIDRKKYIYLNHKCLKLEDTFK